MPDNRYAATTAPTITRGSRSRDIGVSATGRSTTSASIGLPLRQELQQVRIGGEDDRRLVVQNLLVRLERAQELVELRILAVRLAVDARGFGVALAFQLLGVAIRLGEQLLALTVGFRAHLDGDLF